MAADRSGKTFIIVRQIVIRAMRSAGSRHVIFRLRFNHIKQSIFMETLPELFKKDPQLAQIRDKVVWNRSDYFITLPNGSEIWMGGLDDKERPESARQRIRHDLFQRKQPDPLFVGHYRPDPVSAERAEDCEQVLF